MSADVENPETYQPPAWRFKLSMRFLLLVIAILFGVYKVWPQDGMSIAIVAIPGCVGLILGRALAIACKLARSGQWLVGGIGFALAVHSTWPVHASVGSCGTHNIDEHGWPAPFLLVDWSELSLFSFHPTILLFNILACTFLLFIAIRLTKRLERTWQIESPASSRLMIALLLAPTLLLIFLRTMEFPQNLFLIALVVPVVIGIISGVHHSTRLDTQPFETDETFKESWKL